MLYRKNYNWIELIPLLSFFVGAAIVVISQFINSLLTYHGSWPDLEKGLISILIYFIAMILASLFCIWSLVFAIAKKKSCQEFSLISLMSCLLNGGYVLAVLIIYYMSI